MKKIFFILGIITAGLTTISCERDVTELNVDPKHPTSVQSDQLLATAQYQQFYFIASPNVNQGNFVFFTQQFAETTYTDETNYNLVTRNQPRNFYNRMYDRVLKNYVDAENSINNEVLSAAVKKNRKAVLEISSVYAWEVLVDTYGNIPYSQAFKAPEILSPAYDDAKTIYADLFKRIDAAVAMINTSADGFPANSDLVYHGDLNQWKKFAQSIKLRLAMNLADVDAPTSKAKAIEAINAGVMTSNSDSYSLTFDGGQFTAPIYDELVASGRYDFIPSALVVNLMNAKSDPRRPVYFTTVGGAYKGGKFGSGNAYGNFSHMNEVFRSSTGPVNLLSYAEVCFLKAEAAARGYGVSDAATEYTKGITASMQEYGVDAADIATYVAAHPFDATNWKKSIGEEAYIALFTRSFAAWNFARRLDNPVFVNPANSLTTGVPVRMPYSDQEYLVNKTNVTAAGTAIGGDTPVTKLFWDKF